MFWIVNDSVQPEQLTRIIKDCEEVLPGLDIQRIIDCQHISPDEIEKLEKSKVFFTQF